MRRRRKYLFCIVSLASIFLLSLFLSCISDFTTNVLEKQIPSYVVKPGKRYHVVFSDSVAAFYRSIPADSLIYVMLQPMFKPAAIIKADDFVGTRHKKWDTFLAFVAKKKLRVGLGLIANSLIYADDDAIKQLKSLNTFQFEFFLHGWDHRVEDDIAEFQGTSLREQIDHLQWSMDIIKNTLNYTPHTFGAPANRYDSLTTLALRQFPEIKIWFFGQPYSGLFILPHTVDAESARGLVTDPDQFAFQYQHYKDQAAIVLEVHPQLWDESQYERFQDIMLYLLKEGRRFVTPFGYFAWKEDKNKIRLSWTNETAVIIDCTDCQYAHDLVFLFKPEDMYPIDIGIPD